MPSRPVVWKVCPALATNGAGANTLSCKEKIMTMQRQVTNTMMELWLCRPALVRQEAWTPRRVDS
jgi:hypothetical protein